MENFVILRKIKSMLLSGQYIVDFSSKTFDEITEFKLQEPDICIENISKSFDRFSSLRTLHLEKVHFEFNDKDSFAISSLKKLKIIFSKV